MVVGTQKNDFKKTFLNNQQAMLLINLSFEIIQAANNSAGDCIFIKDTQLRYLDANPCMEKKFNMPLSSIIGKTDADIFGAEEALQSEIVDMQVLQGKTMRIEHSKEFNNMFFTFYMVKVPIKDENNNIIGLCGLAKDITASRESASVLKKYEIQLEVQNKALIAKNLALKELISQVEEEKNKVKSNISSHIEQEIMPLLNKLALKSKDEKFVILIRKHLIEINGSLRSSHHEQDYNFTPRSFPTQYILQEFSLPDYYQDFIIQ